MNATAIYVILIVLAGLLIIADVSLRKKGKVESIDLKSYSSWRLGTAAVALVVLLVAVAYF